jgi:2-dehydropantoate 2-reductase
MNNRTIGMAGAGSIGCFVGGMLVAGGRRTALLARPRVIGEIEAKGLRLTSFEGFDQTIHLNAFTLSDDPTSRMQAWCWSRSERGYRRMADIIAKNAPPDVVVVSLQNGVGNVAVLRNLLPGRRVLGGMVPFNVIALGEGRFHRATSGDIVIERDDADTAGKLSVPGLKMRATDNIDGVQWGKLRVNLNNALNALADLPLRRQLAQRPWRWLFADQMAEGLAAIRSEGIKPVSPTPIPAGWMPPLLRLPDIIFEACWADDEDRSRGASSMGGFAARPPHRDRLFSGRHHRDRRAARARRAAVAPNLGTDPESRGRRQGFAWAIAGADPWLRGLP